MSQIHHEVVFDATPARVYRALTDAADFTKWSGMAAEIDAQEGGRFVCFGVFILGRIVELIPDRRIVLAWRVFDWAEGVYSIARFELTWEGGKTKMVFDQDGVPEAAAAHVDRGWGHKYWEPLKKHLAG